MGIDQDGALLALPLARIEIGQARVTLPVAIHIRVGGQALGPGPPAVAVGHHCRLLQVEGLEMAGEQGRHRRLGQQGNPVAAAVRQEASRLQPTVMEQPGVAPIAGIHDPLGTDKPVEMAAVAVTAGVGAEGLAGAGVDGHRLMAAAAQPAVLHRRSGGIGRIELHHPAVLVAGQSKGIAQASQPAAIANQGAGGGVGGGAIGIDRLHHLILDVLLGAEDGAPGGLATGAVGEAADDLIGQSIVVAEAIGGPQRRGGGTAHAQPLARIPQAAQPRDAPLERPRAAAPGAVGLAPQLQHADPQILQGGGGHRLGQLAQAIALGQGQHVALALAGGQGLLEFGDGQLLTRGLAVARPPAGQADVFEVDGEQGPTSPLLQQGQVVVVEAEASIGQGIPPGGQHVVAVAGGQAEPVAEIAMAVADPLLSGAEAIAGQGQGQRNGLKWRADPRARRWAPWQGGGSRGESQQGQQLAAAPAGRRELRLGHRHRG